MRELAVLGTASQVPTRTRNHNGYFLRWDDEGFLFDPGEGTQRQMTYAGVGARDVTRICVTHFHGDHCFGVPGVLARMALDQVDHPVVAHYPGVDRELFDRLNWLHPAQAGFLRERPADGVRAVVAGPGDGEGTGFGTLTAVALHHRVPTYGYRFQEPDGRRMLPERLAAFGLAGPEIGRLQAAGRIESAAAGRTVGLDEVSAPRPGQSVAFVMDTALCDGVYELADGVDLLIIEATYLAAEAALAAEHRHLTAGQAAAVAAKCGVRSLVLTHFSGRYTEMHGFEQEAREQYDGELHIAKDLDRIAVPARRVMEA